MRFVRFILFCLVLIQPAAVMGWDARETLTKFQDHQIQPVVLPDDIRAVIRILDLDESQQNIVEVRYQTYIATLEDAVQASIDREAPIRKRLDGILLGRYRAAPGETMNLRVELVESKSANWTVADTQLDALLEDIVTIGSPYEDQATTLDRTRFELYRRIYLMPLRLESSSDTYAGEGLDFYELVQDASSQELKNVPQAELTKVLEAWRLAMQDGIRAYAEAERTSAMSERVAVLRNDTGGRINVMIDRSRRWGDRQMIDYDTFVSIYGLCPTSDEAGSWVARYRQANYPWLWAQDDEVERMATWILANGSPEQMASVNEIIPGYLDRREALRLEAEEILSEGRRSGANLCDDAAMKYESAQELIGQLMRNSGQRTVLLEQAKAELEQPLTSGQRSAVTRHLLGL